MKNKDTNITYFNKKDHDSLLKVKNEKINHCINL
jgi:hypothetical protein